MDNKTEISNILDNIERDIQYLRGCYCHSSDGIIDDIEDIINRYRPVKDIYDKNYEKEDI
jgi:hypothetical protein